MRKLGEAYFPNLAAGTIFLLLLIALTSCSTLDISLDQTPEPAQAGTSPESGGVQDAMTVTLSTPGETPQLAVGWRPLTSYIHPVFGYELLVPEGAAAGHDADPHASVDRRPGRRLYQ
jgi:hypothetical protein